MASASSGGSKEDAARHLSGRRASKITPFPLVDKDATEADALTAVIRRLSSAHTLSEVMAVTTHAARSLVQADGVTFVLRDGDLCYYADEDAIGPLWKGKKFPISACISGWVMEHSEAAVIPDIKDDERIPQEAYRPTFVKSLAMVPIRQEEPIGAMGAYWARTHAATSDELERLQTIANAAALAVAFVQRCDAEAALRDRASMLDALLKYIPEGITIARGPDVTIERVSAEGLRCARRAEGDVTGISADQHPDAWQVYDQSGEKLLSPDELPLTRAVKRGETIENERLNLRLPDGHFLPILCNAGPTRDERGNVTGGIIAWRDISDIVELEQERQLLVRELNHRVKNLFGVLSGMIQLTARNSADVGEMDRALTGRVQALGNAHDLIRPAIIPGQSGTSADLGDLVRQVLAPHLDSGRRCSVAGPTITIGANATASLALVIHELATNAAKYGSLSALAGEVEVGWSEQDGVVVLQWRERGGPRVEQEPTSVGFGSKLINVTVKRQLAGRIDYDWDATGLSVRISLPVTSVQH
jgi:two-component sensor histidine kinase